MGGIGATTARLLSHLTPDVVFVDHTRGRTSTGPDGFVDRFRRVLDAFPDTRGETVSELAEGSLLIHETTWRGQHTAPLKLPGYDHVPPTNEWMTLHLVTYMEFDGSGANGPYGRTAIQGKCQYQRYLSA